jgi:hypothetical protein
MAIKDLDTGRYITGVLQKGERGGTYKLLQARLSAQEIDGIRAALDQHIQGSRIETSSWIPGNDWRGTPYQAIYDKAANCSYDLSAMMFGIMVWEAFERHEDDWYTSRFSMGGEEDRFRVYFKSGC